MSKQILFYSDSLNSLLIQTDIVKKSIDESDDDMLIFESELGPIGFHRFSLKDLNLINLGSFDEKGNRSSK